MARAMRAGGGVEPHAETAEQGRGLAVRHLAGLVGFVASRSAVIHVSHREPMGPACAENLLAAGPAVVIRKVKSLVLALLLSIAALAQQPQDLGPTAQGTGNLA